VVEADGGLFYPWHVQIRSRGEWVTFEGFRTEPQARARAAELRMEGLTGRRTRRDAQNPYKGEVFENRNGALWRIDEVLDDRRIRVEPAGRRVPGAQTWSRSALLHMKQVRQKVENQAAKEIEKVAGPPAEAPAPPGILTSIFGGGAEEPSPQMALDFTRESPPQWKKQRASRAKKAVVATDPAGRRRRRRARAGSRRALFVQTLVFNRKQWSIPRAKDWARKHGYRAGKVDVNTSSIRLRQVDPRRVRVVGSKRFGRAGITAVFARW
jgi:hypothetical protein